MGDFVVRAQADFGERSMKYRLKELKELEQLPSMSLVYITF